MVTVSLGPQVIIILKELRQIELFVPSAKGKIRLHFIVFKEGFAEGGLRRGGSCDCFVHIAR